MACDGPNGALLEAIEAADLDAVNKALWEGADAAVARKRVTLKVNTIGWVSSEVREDTRFAESALCLAVRVGDAQVLERLLKAGSDPNRPIEWKVPSTSIGSWTRADWEGERWRAEDAHSFQSALCFALASSPQGRKFNKPGADVTVTDPILSSPGWDVLPLVPSAVVVRTLLSYNARIGSPELAAARELRNGRNKWGQPVPPRPEFLELLEAHLAGPSPTRSTTPSDAITFVDVDLGSAVGTVPASDEPKVRGTLTEAAAKLHKQLDVAAAAAAASAANAAEPGGKPPSTPTSGTPGSLDRLPTFDASRNQNSVVTKRRFAAKRSDSRSRVGSIGGRDSFCETCDPDEAAAVQEKLSSLERAVQERADLERKLADMAREAAEREDALRALEAERERDAARVDELENVAEELADAHFRISGLEGDLHDERERSTELQAAVEERDEAIAGFGDQLRVLRGQVAAFEEGARESEALRARVATLEVQIAELEQAARERDELRKKVAALTEAGEAKDAAVERLEMDRRANEARVAALEESLEAAQRKVAKLESAMQSDRAKATTQLSDARSQSSALLSSLRAQLAAAQSEAQGLRAQVADMKRESHEREKDFEHEVAQLERDHSLGTHRVMELRAANAALTGQVEELQKLLEEAKAGGVARQASAGSGASWGTTYGAGRGVTPNPPSAPVPAPALTAAPAAPPTLATARASAQSPTPALPPTTRTPSTTSSGPALRNSNDTEPRSLAYRLSRAETVETVDTVSTTTCASDVFAGEDDMMARSGPLYLPDSTDAEVSVDMFGTMYRFPLVWKNAAEAPIGDIMGVLGKPQWITHRAWGYKRVECDDKARSITFGPRKSSMRSKFSGDSQYCFTIFFSTPHMYNAAVECFPQKTESLTLHDFRDGFVDALASIVNDDGSGEGINADWATIVPPPDIVPETPKSDREFHVVYVIKDHRQMLSGACHKRVREWMEAALVSGSWRRS